jgi:3-keto-5-aminohexanoate cleavage enzyme
MPADIPVIIEAALNGGRDRREHPRVPYTPAAVAEEALRCAEAGASIVHFHARAATGGWSADPAWYAEAIRRIREAAPDVLVSLTSLRPAGVSVSSVVNALRALAADPATRPDLISVNVGHIALWELIAPSEGQEHALLRRRTLHFPNDYEDIAALLSACRATGVFPELGIMDLGFLSQAAALRQDGLLPTVPWLLLELDSPAWGSGNQVAPATAASYTALAAGMRALFPVSSWAAHGAGIATYEIVLRALEDGPRAHVRVGFEDALEGPDRQLAESNAQLVEWATARARERGRRPATLSEARTIIGGWG